MKLRVKGRYHNQPAQLHFDGPAQVELDDKKAEFLLRDAPDNFEVVNLGTVTMPAVDEDEATDEPEPISAERKAPDQPPADKMIKEPRRKK